MEKQKNIYKNIEKKAIEMIKKISKKKNFLKNRKGSLHFTVEENLFKAIYQVL